MTPDRHRDTYDPGPDEHDTGRPSPSELAADREDDREAERCEVARCRARAGNDGFCNFHGPQW